MDAGLMFTFLLTAALVAAGSADPAPPDPSNLSAVVGHCSNVALLEYVATEDELVDLIYQDVVAEVAADQGVTEEASLRQLLDETFNAAEQTWTITDAWAQGNLGNELDADDSELTPIALLFGLLYDCALDSLGVPERVQSHIGTTRALDGTQEDSWEDYSARWTYHPDSGMNITIWKP